MDLVLSYIQQGFSAVFAFVLLLGLLIFVHELGHFAVAKWSGVRVEVFSLGFGKKLFSFKRGDTTYCVSLIPLGGYVKMFGDEAGAEIPESEKKYSFTHKPVAQRIAVVLAGPLMNFFFAILIFTVVAFLGEEVRSPVVGDLSPKSKVYAEGLRSGDKVVRVNDRPIISWDEFQEELNKNVDQKLAVNVQRVGIEQAVNVELKPESKPNPNLLSLDASIGDIEGLTYLSKAPVLGVRSQFPAAKAGLKTGDRILSVNGVELKHFRELDNLLLPHQNREITLEIERSAQPESKKPEKLKLQVNFHTFSSMSMLGIEGSELYLYKVMPSSPAERGGLRVGDRVVKVGDATPVVWEDVLQAVKSYTGKDFLRITVDREGSEKTFVVVPEMTSQMNLQGGEEKRFTIGIVPWIQLSAPELTQLQIHGPLDGIKHGLQRTWDVTVMTVVSFLRLIQNKISPKNIGGVISIGQAAHETLKIGLKHFLTMMAAISVNLFILNLLPIPVLDGGHLLFYVIEALRGAPLNMRKMEIAQQIGLFVLMSLMVYALFNDVSRILGFW
ncbi:MAG: RIP metalloprotease RseP [Bdellovibrio sp.]|nr:MAG: RIP metalloprotease RseP [Bdellovibrio sp.]